MGLFDDLFGGLSLPGLDDISGYVSTATKFIDSFDSPAPPSFASAPVVGGVPATVAYNGGGGMMYPAMATVPAISGAIGAVLPAGAGAMMRRYILQFFRSKFGRSIPWGQILTFGKRWGLTALVGLGLTAEMANYIIGQTMKKHRRMNPANVKALRKSVRRLQSFDTLACRVNAQLSTLAGRGGRRPGRRAGVGRRCFKCRKSPCSC